MKNSKFPLKYSKNVYNALENKKPIVAIESTIFAHGLPPKVNLECALQVEETIKKLDVTPAIIAINNGYINIGCEPELLNILTSSNDIEKVSTRDVMPLLLSKRCGATTVAGTIVCAAAAKINIMVTGGIGGVHKDVNRSNDISADLNELSRNSIAVVCSGVKSILDIRKTLEYLETLGIPIIGFKTDTFPSFYSLDSGFKTTYHTHSYKEIAYIIEKQKLLNRAIIITNPPPKSSAINSEDINKWTDIALIEVKKNNITGHKITPYILKRLRELSGGSTLKTNMDLILENSKLSSLIAKNLKIII